MPSGLTPDHAAALYGAAGRGELLAHYQPQVDVKTGDVVAVEALARWLHPEQGAIDPAAFVAAAEANGAIVEIGAFMLGESVRQLRRWRDRGLQLELSVNVSPVELDGAEFAARLVSLLMEESLAPQLITLEITESLPIHDLPRVAARLEVLRALGVGISLDDVGAGFTSIEQVRALPATEVKIDRSVIQGPDLEPRSALSRGIRDAKEQGIRVVAEGVETEEQLRRAIAIGADRAQGYLLGRPSSAEWIEQLIP